MLLRALNKAFLGGMHHFLKANQSVSFVLWLKAIFATVAMASEESRFPCPSDFDGTITQILAFSITMGPTFSKSFINVSFPYSSHSFTSIVFSVIHPSPQWFPPTSISSSSL